MTKIIETRVLTTPRLSEVQREVMKTVYSAESGRLAHENIVGAGDNERMNHVTAVEVLSTIGLIDDSVKDEISVTEQGVKVMKDENLIDQSGEVIDDPSKEDDGAADMTQQKQPAGEMPASAGDPISQMPDDAAGGGMPPMESLTMIQAAHKALMEKEELDNLRSDQ